MNNSIKKYVPYAAIIFGIYIIIPIVFRNGALTNFVGIAWYFIFPATAATSAAVFCSKYGMDFLFSLIAPIFYLPSMFLFYGGVNVTNIILLIVYLVAGLFGLFIGDLALGDKRREKEKQAQAQAEEMMLEAKRRDERELEKLAAEGKQADKEVRQPQRHTANNSSYHTKPQTESKSTDDFDYDKYLSDIDKKNNDSEAEIDDILNEYGKH